MPGTSLSGIHTPYFWFFILQTGLAMCLREWTPLAEQGVASAQFNLGLMYGLGRGVIQDNVYAHLWGNIAASNGKEGGGKLRDLVAKEMTPSQLEKAQDLARECVRKKKRQRVLSRTPPTPHFLYPF